MYKYKNIKEIFLKRQITRRFIFEISLNFPRYSCNLKNSRISLYWYWNWINFSSPLIAFFNNHQDVFIINP